MTKMNYNRPVHQRIDDRKKLTIKISRKDLGTEPVVISNIIRFGRYRNCNLSEVPSNYLEWLVTVSDDSTALKYCRELAKRPNYIKYNFKK